MTIILQYISATQDRFQIHIHYLYFADCTPERSCLGKKDFSGPRFQEEGTSEFEVAEHEADAAFLR